MFAVIKTGGKQYKVTQGQELLVERLGKKDAEIKLDDLLEGKKVTAKIIEEVKGPKVHIFKYKRRKNYKRSLGHRQKYSKIKIEKIQ